MKNAKTNDVGTPVTIIFTGGRWIVLIEQGVVGTAGSWQELVEMSNRNRWAISNRGNLIPAARALLQF
jgi:hypothetical protein